MDTGSVFEQVFKAPWYNISPSNATGLGNGTLLCTSEGFPLSFCVVKTETEYFIII